MKTNHTPGPWKAFKPGNSNGFWYVSDHDIVLYGPNAEADAKLIACAPELLLYLKGIIDAYSDVKSTDGYYTLKETGLFQQAEELIKKAT